MTEPPDESADPFSPPTLPSDRIPDVVAPSGGPFEKGSAIVFAAIFAGLAIYFVWWQIAANQMMIAKTVLTVVFVVIAMAAAEGAMSTTSVNKTAIVRGWLFRRTIELNEIVAVSSIKVLPGAGYIMQMRLKDGRSLKTYGYGPEILGAFQAIAEQLQQTDREANITDIASADSDSDASGVVNASGRLTVDENYRALHLHLGADPGNQYVSAAALAASMLAIGVTFHFMPNVRRKDLSALFCGGIGVVGTAVRLSRAVRETRERRKAQEAWKNEEGPYRLQQLNIDSEGIEIRTGGDHEHLVWGAFSHFKSNEDFVLLYPGEYYFVIPRSFFAVATDWTSFNQIVKRNVKRDTGRGFRVADRQNLGSA